MPHSSRKPELFSGYPIPQDLHSRGWDNEHDYFPLIVYFTDCLNRAINEILSDLIICFFQVNFNCHPLFILSLHRVDNLLRNDNIIRDVSASNESNLLLCNNSGKHYLESVSYNLHNQFIKDSTKVDRSKLRGFLRLCNLWTYNNECIV